MAKVDVKLNLRALNALMTSPAVQAEVNRRGQSLASNAGPDFEYVERGHRYVARGYVQPANARGAREQAKNAALERALGSSR